jgi:hypothetical protein
VLATIAAVLWPRNFSGSCTVTSRNPLIHNGATTATKSERFDPKMCARFLCHGVAAAPDGPFATVNLREFLFFLRTRVNKALSPWVAISSAGKGGHAHARARTQDKTQDHARVGRGALLQQRGAHIVGYYTEGRPSPNWGALRALGWGRAR